MRALHYMDGQEAESLLHQANPTPIDDEPQSLAECQQRIAAGEFLTLDQILNSIKF